MTVDFKLNADAARSNAVKDEIAGAEKSVALFNPVMKLLVAERIRPSLIT